MSGQDILIEQLRADVERLRDDRADLQERCNRLSAEKAEALRMLERAERERDYVAGYEADLVAIRRVLDAVDAPHDCEDGCSMEPKRIRLLAAERDEARAERDRRPDISPEDCDATVLVCALTDNAVLWPDGKRAADRIVNALRAHAAKVKP